MPQRSMRKAHKLDTQTHYPAGVFTAWERETKRKQPRYVQGKQRRCHRDRRINLGRYAEKNAENAEEPNQRKRVGHSWFMHQSPLHRRSIRGACKVGIQAVKDSVYFRFLFLSLSLGSSVGLMKTRRQDQ